MGVIKVEFEISADEEAAFSEYLDAQCLDRDKWLKRIAYNCLVQAVGKWRQPVGKINPAFNKKTEVKRGKGR